MFLPQVPLIKPRCSKIFLTIRSCIDVHSGAGRGERGRGGNRVNLVNLMNPLKRLKN
jgi:hypothetical protein